MILERLEQRVLILPAVARALQKHLQHSDIVWRVDTEFVPFDRSSALEANISALTPSGIEEVAAAFEKVRDIIPDMLQRTRSHG